MDVWDQGVALLIKPPYRTVPYRTILPQGDVLSIQFFSKQEFLPNTIIIVFGVLKALN